MMVLVMRAVIADGVMRMGKLLSSQNKPCSKPMATTELRSLSFAWYKGTDTPMEENEGHLTPAWRLGTLLGPEHNRILAFLRKYPIGLVPNRARAGDTICVLHGISTPAVLRMVGECYEYIGHCYIDGMMYGEACDWGEGEGDEFTLI